MKKLFNKVIVTYFFKKWEILLLFILSLLPFYWFQGGYVLIGHDSGFRWDYDQQIQRIFYSWDWIVNFGVQSRFKGFIITQLPEVFFSYVTHSFDLGQKIALVFWFFIIGLGMYVLLRSTFPENKYRFFRLFSSIFYMYNFFVFSGWGIGERAKFSLFAALPIALLLIYNVFIRNRSLIKNGIAFGFLYFFLNGGGVLPLYGGTIIILTIAVTVCSFYRLKWYGWKEVGFIIKFIISFFIPFFLLNAYYILPSIDLVNSSYTTSVNQQGGIEGLINWERVISRYASFINVIRLQGIPDWYDNISNFSKLYLTNPILIGASFLPISSIVIGLIFIRFHAIKRDRKVFLGLLIMAIPIGLLFTMGTHPPFGLIYEFAMKKIPGFSMFRSSFYKFAPAFWFPVIVLCGYYLNEAINYIKSKGIILIISGFFLVGLLAYHFPFFTFDAFALTKPFSTRVKIPDYLSNITNAIKKNVNIESSILVLPKLDTEYIHDFPMDSYKWGYFSTEIFPRNAIQRQFIANDSQVTLVTSLYDAIYQQNSSKIAYFSQVLGIEYILWRGDVLLSDIDLQKNPYKNIREMLITDSLFTQVFHSGDWYLYRINVPNIEKKVSIFDKADTYNGDERTAAFLIEKNSLTDRRPVITEVSDDIYSVIVKNNYVLANCIMCSKNEYKSLVDSIGLPNQRLLPNSNLFFLQKMKDEKQLKNTVDKPEERIDVDIALAQNQLSYVIRLADKSYLIAYRTYMNEVIHIWNTLQGETRDKYGIRLLAYMEAHKKIIALNELLKQDTIQEWLETSIELIQKDIWMSTFHSYRFFATISKEGFYRIDTNIEQELIESVKIDGRYVSIADQLQLTQGSHNIELEINQASYPLVFKPILTLGTTQQAENYDFSVPVEFKMNNPTSYSIRIEKNPKTPFLILFKEQYDPQWEISIPNAKHIIVDGYANGWIVENLTNAEFSISFRAQKFTNIGLVISLVSVIVLGYFLLMKM